MHSDLSSHRGLLLIGLFTSAALIAACGGGTEEQSTNDSAPVSAPAPAPAPPPATAPTGTATLSWDAPAASVTGYRVYYGTSSRSYSQALGSGAFVATSTYVAAGLQSGRTYYFAVTAIYAAGAESGFSNEVSKTIP